MSKSVKLRVPLAFDEEKKLYDPEAAEKGKRYFCPACQDTVILRKGKIKTPHFAHKVSETCNQETIIHKTAKQLIVDVISDWKSGKTDAPVLKRTCELCRQSKDQPLPDKVECAMLEYRMPDGFIVDVVLMVENKPAAAMEIRVSHAVDENKAKSLSIPFIELDGQKVIENPTIFQPIRDRFQPLTCTTCKQAKEQYLVKVNEVAEQTGVELPDRYYRYGLYECRRCKHEIIVFAWPKISKGAAPNEKPIPRMIQRHYFNFAGRNYWVNICPYCESFWGHWILFSESDGPFFGIRCEENSREAYHKDMQDIVGRAIYNGILTES